MIDVKSLSGRIDAVVARHAARGVHFEVQPDDREIFIDGLHRDLGDPATKGRGADAMTDLCRIADEFGLPVELSHMADEPGLGPYYARFGFSHYEVTGGNPELRSMRREPTSS